MGQDDGRIGGRDDNETDETKNEMSDETDDGTELIVCPVLSTKGLLLMLA